jgi:beta-galactosidase
MDRFIICIALSLVVLPAMGQDQSRAREKLLMDFGWHFALGNAGDAGKDFDHGTGYFSYFAKAGYADGAASKSFDDRGWRTLDLPHDWCVELPFDRRGSSSHGYRAMGRAFPENSIGWYRKTFSLPKSDAGKRIAVAFEGVFRNCIVWVNGFYLGTEHSGYAGFSYDISDYLDYGGENVIAVRVDASMEEGWFYEGAGIYRHVWLIKRSPLHVIEDGTFVTTAFRKYDAVVTVRTTVVNESQNSAAFTIKESILDSSGRTVAAGSIRNLALKAGGEGEYTSRYLVANPGVWSPETPYLNTLKTVIVSAGAVTDTYGTVFGIRTVRFDPDQGFFLNGRHLKILGTADHQDHAGVGIAVPDALQEFRIRRLKEMGSNAIRTAHNPPAPALLDACDRLGMLVLDENRSMGVNKEQLDCLDRLMRRDRNHPSVFLWSLGNEEWAIEGNIKGARIGSALQAFAQRRDSSRAFTAAVSGGWNAGIGMVMQVMGYNYILQGDIDEHHRRFPRQPGIGTEEGNTVGTRDTYVSDDARAHMAAGSREGEGTEIGWKFYSARPFLCGLFFWTGFDYRGEMHPYDWPAVSSQFGILDVCGFPKDIFYYLKSWWGKDPVLHIVPDWKARGREGEQTTVKVYSNCDQVELLLDAGTLGRKDMPENGHLEWGLTYRRGVLSARGYSAGKVILESSVEPPGPASAVQLVPDRTGIRADGEDVSVVAVQATDRQGVIRTDDSSTISFSLEGPGRIIGVGNGDPSSHEPDRFYETARIAHIENLRELAVGSLVDRPEVSQGVDVSTWKPALKSEQSDVRRSPGDTCLVVRGTFLLDDVTDETRITLFTRSILAGQQVYVNGHLLAADDREEVSRASFLLDHGIVKPGQNVYAVVGRRFRRTYPGDEPNTDPGVVRLVSPAGLWSRRLFHGLAQVIIQSTKRPGVLILRARAEESGEEAVARFEVHPASARPSVH